MDSVNADIEIRNKIIEEIEKQLAEKKIILLDENKPLREGETQAPYKQEYHNLKEQFTELDKEYSELKTAVVKLLE